jgi:L-ribulose-5-phosphate 3-epimerase
VSDLPEIHQRLAVCSWSLRPTDPADLIQKLHQTGIKRVQLALDPLREQIKTWGEAPRLLADQGITIVSGMFGCVGEDYSTLESIRRTGGIAPDQTWEQNWKNIQATAPLAQQLGLKLVTFHAGFLPHEEQHPSYQKILRRLNEVAETFLRAGITLGFETGQESAPVLLRVLRAIRFNNAGVNFDPANMLLYDKGDPVQAVRTLSPFLKQIHIKDAIRSKVPGQWGQEVPAGTGEVNWPAFFATLKTLNYQGNLVLEREAGEQRVPDIITARQVVERLFT